MKRSSIQKRAMCFRHGYGTYPAETNVVYTVEKPPAPAVLRAVYVCEKCHKRYKGDECPRCKEQE